MNSNLSQTAVRQKSDWLRANRGTIARLSEQLGFTPQFVREVFWELATSKDRLVEQSLINRGAPGFKSLLASQTER